MENCRRRLEWRTIEKGEDGEPYKDGIVEGQL